MDRSMPMKRSKQKQLLLPSIASLPEELVIEVLARVGSSSVNGLFNLKQSCKAFYKAGHDAEVLRRVSVDKLPAVPWWDSSEYISFVRQCEEKNNPEALFKRGMVEYFNSKKQKQDLGIEFLKKAACLGHEEAAYILGLIMLCTNIELKAEAFEFLRSMEKGSTSTKIKKCRKRLKEIIGQMWIRHGSLPQPEPMCTSLVCKRNDLKSDPWLSIEDEEPSNCEACRWDREIVLVRSILYV